MCAHGVLCLEIGYMTNEQDKDPAFFSAPIQMHHKATLLDFNPMLLTRFQVTLKIKRSRFICNNVSTTVSMRRGF